MCLSKRIINLLIFSFVLSNNAYSEDDTTTFNQLIDKSFEELLKTKVVTASKFSQDLRESPSTVSIITAREISQFGANNLYEVLERATSVFATGSFFFPQNVISMRGDLQSHSDNHVLILLNGRLLRESYSGGVNFPIYTSFPLNIINRLEIIRGPGSVLYGTNAFSGVINIVTQNVSANNSSVKATVGSLGTQGLNYSQSYTDDSVEVLASLSVFNEDGWNFASYDQNGLFDEKDYGEDNVSFFTDIRASKYRFQLFYADSEQDFMGASANWSGEPPINERLMQGTRLFGDLGYETSVNEKSDLKINLSYTAMSFDHYNYKAKSKDLFAEVLYEYRFSDKVNWINGLTYWHQDVDSIGRRNAAPVNAFTSVWLEYYSQLAVSLTDDLSITAGVQVNKPEAISSDTIPRISINYLIDDQWGVRLSSSSAFRAAFGVETGFDLILRNNDGSIRGGLRGNPLLEPEKVETHELAINYQSQYAQFEAVYFNSYLTNLIGRQRAADNVLDFVNENVLDIDGIELSGKWHINEQVAVNYGYTQQNSAYHANELTHTPVPENMLKLGAVFKTDDDKYIFGIYDTYFDAVKNNRNLTTQPISTNGQNPPPSSYHLLTFSTKIDLNQVFLLPAKSDFELNFYIYNLLDEDIYHPEFVGQQLQSIPARAERSFYLSISKSF